MVINVYIYTLFYFFKYLEFELVLCELKKMLKFHVGNIVYNIVLTGFVLRELHSNS
jgi:hypothetical protein